MIALKNSFAASSRRADAKIGLLKEIVERIQNGEEVDVEGLLGTGDAKREQEWEDVLREIEEEDEAWERSRRSKSKHGRNLEDSKVVTTIPGSKNNVQSAEEVNSKPPVGFF